MSASPKNSFCIEDLFPFGNGVIAVQPVAIRNDVTENRSTLGSA